MTDLVTEAEHLLPRTGGDRHWSRIAEVLGRLSDSGIAAELGYEGIREMASARFGLTPSDLQEYLTLWALMKRWSQHQVDWAMVSRSNAKLLRKVVGLGAEPAQWLEPARGPYAAMREKVKGQLGEEAWTKVTVSVPTHLTSLIEAAMKKAVPAAVNDVQADPERWKDRDVAFRCLEQLCQHYLEDPDV